MADVMQTTFSYVFSSMKMLTNWFPLGFVPCFQIYNNSKCEYIFIIYKTVQHVKSKHFEMKPEQNGCHLADNIFQCIFVDEN